MIDMDGFVARYKDDPVAFAIEVLELDYIDSPCGDPACDLCRNFTAEMLLSVRDHRRTLISACHDSAKTFTASIVCWWWVLCHPPAVVMTSSSSDRQVKKGIWKEIRARWQGSEFLRQNFPEPNQAAWEYPDEADWYMLGFSTNPDSAEAGATKVQSQHSPNLLLIFDEATAVHRLIWDAVKGSLTQPHNHWMVLHNPTDPAAQVAAEWRAGEAKGWNCIQIDAYDTPNLIHGDGANPHLITGQWVDEYRRDVGEDSPMFMARVRGLTPDMAVDTLISTGDFLRALAREPKPIEGLYPAISMGVDVARFGNDLTAIYVICEGQILHSEAYGKQDTVFTAARTIELAQKYGIHLQHARRISIDDTGVGGGVTDICRANGWNVNAEDFGCVPVEHDENAPCYDRRTELWVNMRDWLREDAELADLDIDTRRHLEGDLPGVKYEWRLKADQTVRKLEPKKDMKKRIGHSPDHGDAVALALAWKTARTRLYDPSDLVTSTRSHAPTTNASSIQHESYEEDRVNRKARGKPKRMYE